VSVRWEELQEGSTGLAPRVFGPLTRTDIVRYQGASGDMNPIHHDEPFATAAGYPAPLAIGMLQASMLANWAAEWLGPENVRRTRVRWKEQVWPGDTLTYSGVVTKKYTEGNERKIDVELTCARQTGGVAVQGWMTFVLP
jgi:acyl dehydratase